MCQGPRSIQGLEGKGHCTSAYCSIYLPDPSSCPTIATTCQYFAEHRSMQLVSPTLSIPSLYGFVAHLSWQADTILLSNSTLYSNSVAAMAIAAAAACASSAAF
eukprot:GHRR01005221.1.p2 GENE.GHRR01005221.1~~GHRR01005221.1.p2  ORF type:complete len:104 (-),score=18.18 GHRR01005221.1:169-480(-)